MFSFFLVRVICVHTAYKDLIAKKRFENSISVGDLRWRVAAIAYRGPPLGVRNGMGDDLDRFLFSEGACHVRVNA